MFEAAGIHLVHVLIGVIEGINWIGGLSIETIFPLFLCYVELDSFGRSERIVFDISLGEPIQTANQYFKFYL